jgi:hypothetical protein
MEAAVNRIRVLAAILALALAVAPVAAHAARPAASAGTLANLKRLYILGGRFQALQLTGTVCAIPAKDRAAQQRMMRRALQGAERARPAALRGRIALLSKALVARRKAILTCTRAAGIPAVVQTIPTPANLPPPSLPPGTGSRGPVIVPISLADIVKSRTLDLTAQLGGGTLPPGLSPLELATLNDRACRGVDVICVGVDRVLLDAELKDLMNTSLLGLALGNLGTLNLNGLLTQVSSVLDSGQVGGLIGVERVDDTHLRLVPAGPLAQLQTVESVPETIVGQIELVGVVRCPPATVNGAPRACAS